MDTVPQKLLLSIPLKKADTVQWTPVLLAYIIMSYAEESQKYESECELLQSLRSRALNQPSENTFALEDLQIYYNQLTFVGSRFPLNLNLHIGWFPAIPQKNNSKPEVFSNLNYEKCCVLFRMAGMYSELGCAQSWVSTEGTRKACQYFQNAAGCLKYIQSDLLSDLRAQPPQDFELIDSLIALMMAQAHECILQKAIMEHMKHGTVARLAVKVADLYTTSLSAKSIPYPQLEQYAGAKSHYFNAVAQYQKANEAISNGRYGEEVARLRLAKASNAQALLLLKSLHPQFVKSVHQLEESIQRDLLRAEKDNDVVYMETVPEASQLAPILRSDMVKPTVPSFVTSPNYWLVLKDRPEDELYIKRPLFEKLVPFAVHQAVKVYADKRDRVIKTEIVEKNKTLDENCQKILKDLNIPYSLDVVDSLPPKLKEYAEEVQHEGGIQSLYDMLMKVQTMSKKTLLLIEEGFDALEEENEQDVTLSRQYGKLWKRPPSRALTKNLLTMGSQYHDTVQAAQKADRIVQAKVNNWGKAIAMLSRPCSEIQTHIPNIPVDEEDYTVICQLLSETRSKLDQLDETSAIRKGIERKAKVMAQEEDISDALLAKANELSGGSPVVKLEPEQFSAEFEHYLSAYRLFQEQICALANTQAELLQAIEDLHGQLLLLTNNKSILAKREKAVSNLESAFTKFKEIRTNLVEGIKFYSDYSDTITQFRDDCLEFGLTRRLEATELTQEVVPHRLLVKK